MKWRVAALLSLLLLAACKDDKDKKKDDPGATQPEDEDTTFAEDGSDANAADTDAQLVASTLVSSSPGTIGLASLDASDIATKDVGDGVKTVYLPRSCVDGKKTKDDEATYTFTNCFGPNGLGGVTGSVVVHFSSTPTTLHLDLTYTGMKVNNAEIDGAASADIVADGAKRTMTWSATLDGTTAHDKKFSYRSTNTIAWTLGDKCFSLDGSTEGQVRQRDIKTEIQSYKRCGRGCPEAGGKIVVTNVAKNKVVTLDFDGTNKATYTNANGKQIALQLLCKE